MNPHAPAVTIQDFKEYATPQNSTLYTQGEAAFLELTRQSPASESSSFIDRLAGKLEALYQDRSHEIRVAMGQGEAPRTHRANLDRYLKEHLSTHIANVHEDIKHVAPLAQSQEGGMKALEFYLVTEAVERLTDRLFAAHHNSPDTACTASGCQHRGGVGHPVAEMGKQPVDTTASMGR